MSGKYYKNLILPTFFSFEAKKTTLSESKLYLIFTL